MRHATGVGGGGGGGGGVTSTQGQLWLYEIETLHRLVGADGVHMWEC